MKIEKLQENVRPYADASVQLKRMKNIFEVRSMSRKAEIPIYKLDKDFFVDLSTGEVKEFKHTERRVDNLTIFQKNAPFIPNADLSKIWGHGFVKIKALKNVDNIGAYLSAYLGDMELDEALAASSGGSGFKVVESADKDGKRQTKAIVKGARLKLYPKGFRLFRKSKGILPPTIKDCTEAEAMREIGSAVLTYEKTIKLVNDDGKTCNIINYRHYNKKRKGGGVTNG